MSGTVLSTLCSICHAEPPKYKCPRCGARTCSVSCIQKHKARADCDGVRNPRAFMPLRQLKTESGIDHDFNFLTSIERARQRAEKDIVEARKLLSEKELRPKNEDKQFQKVWYGDELHHIPVQTQPYEKHGRAQEGPAPIDGFDKHVRRRLRYLDIEAITMPKGMARRRENKTAFNRRTQTINWQVEWLVYSASELGLPAQQAQQPLRVLYKTLEGTPLNAALAVTLDWHRGQLDRQSRQQQDPTETDPEADPDLDEPPKKKNKTHHSTGGGGSNNKKKPPSPNQNPSTATWPTAPYTAQSRLTSAWSQTATSPHVETTLEEQLGAWQFYLVKAVHQSTSTTTTKTATTTTTSHTYRHPAIDLQKSKTIVPLDPTETLAGALAGRTVVEFPTVLAMPGGVAVPEGYAVGVFERRKAAAREAGGDNNGDGNGNNRKRRFEGRHDKNPGQDRGRGPGTGANATGVSGGGGGGGKRARFAPIRGEAQVEEPRSEAEDGEVNSDGDEVLGEALLADVRGSGELMDVAGDDDSDVIPGRKEEEEEEEEEEGEVQDGPDGEKPRGWLVDYGSSDESD